MSGFLRRLSAQALGLGAPVRSAARQAYAAAPMLAEPLAGDGLVAVLEPVPFTSPSSKPAPALALDGQTGLDGLPAPESPREAGTRAEARSRPASRPAPGEPLRQDATAALRPSAAFAPPTALIEASPAETMPGLTPIAVPPSESPADAPELARSELPGRRQTPASRVAMESAQAGRPGRRQAPPPELAPEPADTGLPARRQAPVPLVAPSIQSMAASAATGIAAAMTRPATAAPARLSAETESREVHVSIGRIEITAVHEAAPVRAPARAARKTLSLDDYLAKRQRGRA
jgi:hypothetical protein